MTEERVKHYRNDCIEENELGSGTYGAVYKGRHFEDKGKIVAIKVIDRKKGASRTTAREILDRELDILKELSSTPHKNLIALLDYEKTAQFIVYLVTEFCNGGDFREYLKENVTLTESTIHLFFRQIGNGLNFLHEKNIVHRDMKPENILLCFDGDHYPAPEVIVLKIADFGIGRILSPAGTAVTFCGTQNYKAPEIVPHQQYDTKVDMWSIGIMMFECLVGTSKAQELGELEFPENVSSDLRNLLENLIVQDPKNRFSCDQFLKHPFIWEAMDEKCDQCVETNNEEAEVPSATVFCIDCNENQCSECNRGHNRQKLFKTHRVVPIREKPIPISENIGAIRQSCTSINRSIVEKLKSITDDMAYLKIQQIEPKPIIKEEHLESFWSITFPYIIQRIKMWNGNVLSPEALSSMVDQIQKGVSISDDTRTKSVSRLDCLTYIINAADFMVAQDLLRILSKFPVAIPLIVQDLNHDDKYIVTMPLIQNTVIKLESTPGKISESRLFTTPFRMVVAVRLGTGETGKGTILNQLLENKHTFSSNCEVGSRYGRPRTLEGNVEIVWLTQETCSEVTWKRILKEYYEHHTDELAILANLHGDVLQYKHTLHFLLQMCFSCIVFFMPGFSDSQWNQLKNLLAGKRIVKILVDGDKTVEKDLVSTEIITSRLFSESNQESLRNMLKESLKIDSESMFSSPKPEDNHFGQTLRYVETVSDKNLEMILQFVSQQGIRNVKQLLEHSHFDESSSWNDDFKNLIKWFVAIVCSPAKCAKQSLSYLETQLHQLTDKEFPSICLEISELREKVRPLVTSHARIYRDEASHEMTQDLNELQDKLREALKKSESINLGQEHFFRAIGNIYEKSEMTSEMEQYFCLDDLPNYFADLLINGHAIELLDGDSGKMQPIWLKAILKSVSNKLGALKVFVISVIGVQSSGKSTLLNALFSSRFAVSVGRCSRGLIMRMLLLDDSIRKKCDCDAFILIDSEGLCSPETMNDPNSCQRDRLMVTYVLGISNIIIVNIQGEGMIETTEILQIAVVAMARLLEGGIRPEILMVQHLQERNVAQIDKAKTQFCEAIRKAFELIDKNAVEISASRKCLHELQKCIDSGELFHHFGPFKDGASVNAPPSESYHEDIVKLFDTLLLKAELSENKKTIELWSNHAESFWSCVKKETFALNFKNVQQITDFLYFEKKIAKVKELLERAFQKHREYYRSQIQQKIFCSPENKDAHRTALKTEMMESIGIGLQLIPHECPEMCTICREFTSEYETLLRDISSTVWEVDAKSSLEIKRETLQNTTINMLEQTFDGSAIKNRCLLAYSSVITGELIKASINKPDGFYTEEEQKAIKENIWRMLETEASSMEKRFYPDEDTHVDARFSQALKNEYEEKGIWPTILKDLRNQCFLEVLPENQTVIKQRNWHNMFLQFLSFNKRKPNKDLNNFLSNTINNFISTIFKNRGGDDYLRTGLDFEEGMVTHIRIEYPQIIRSYETKFSVEFDDKLKKELQIYTLQQFKHQMDNLQSTWNKQNKPQEILKHKRDEYFTEIEIRLKSGFSCEGEGQLIAIRLRNAMKKNAIAATFHANVEAVKSLIWTTDSETVRLYYFEQLANEVMDRKKERALKHFQNPKESIEDWYKNTVESVFSNKEKMKIYNYAIDQEFLLVRNEVKASKCKDDIVEILQKHTTNVEDRYVSKFYPKSDLFEPFKQSILSNLEVNFQEIKDITSFPLVSDEPEIKRLLGCTECCYWCGALCWGAQDHQVQKDKDSEIERHHSCHQPSGLNGTHDRVTRKLSCLSCHDRNDTDLVWFKDSQEGNDIPWRDAKNNHFPDWKFNIHCKKAFDKLMQWFFGMLNKDIAKQHGLFPADESVFTPRSRDERSLFLRFMFGVNERVELMRILKHVRRKNIFQIALELSLPVMAISTISDIIIAYYKEIVYQKETSV